jgi:hypothetical protein
VKKQLKIWNILLQTDLETLTDMEEKEKKEKNCAHLKSGSHI